MGVPVPGTTVRCGAGRRLAHLAAIRKGIKNAGRYHPLHVKIAQQLIANNAVDIAVKDIPDFIHGSTTLEIENTTVVVGRPTNWWAL